MHVKTQCMYTNGHRMGITQNSYIPQKYLQATEKNTVMSLYLTSAISHKVKE